MIPVGRVSPSDQKEGYYWSLPNGDKQNRCPWVKIKEDPIWWEHIITAYVGYEKGYLPHTGGLDDQPALFSPTMAIISSAMKDEDDIESEQAKALQSTASKGKTSLIRGNSDGRQSIGVPSKRK